MKDLPILTEVRDGQPYVDEPVYAKTKRLRKAIMLALESGGNACIYLKSHYRHPSWPDILIAYKHIKFRWMTPDGDGGLVPR